MFDLEDRQSDYFSAANAHPARFAALRHLALFDTPAEQAFDRLTRLATKILHSPVALLSLVDRHRSFFKSSMGLPEPWASQREMPLLDSVCQHVVRENAPLIVNDARSNPLVSENQAVWNLKIVAYLGIPLVTCEGHAFGTFAVIDTVPRDWLKEDVTTLGDLAASAMTEIELRAATNQRLQMEQRLHLMESVVGKASVAVLIAEANPEERSVPRIVFVNDAYTHLTGFSSDEVVGGARLILKNSEADRSQIETIHSALTTFKPTSLEFLTQRKDGSTFWAEFNVIPIADALGQYSHWVVIQRDASVQKAAEEARAFAEEIVETILTPLIVLESNLRVRVANRSFYQTFQVDPAETEGRFLFDLGNRQWDIPKLRKLLEDVLPRNNSFGDFVVDHAFEGIGRRAIVLNARQLDPAPGRPALILLAMEDATNLRRASETLTLSELRYRRLFETAQDGILLVDPETRRVFDANPYLIDLMGFSRNEVVGKELWELGFFEDIETNRAAFQMLKEKGYIRYDDMPLRTREGRSIEVEIVSNVYSIGNTFVIQCNIRNVAQRKQAEGELVKAHEELEQRVETRTAELALAKEAAEAANRAKSDFFSRMSHELRTPLHVILGFGQMLEMGTLSDSQRKSTKQIVKGGRHLLALINEVLDIARIEAGGEGMLSPEEVAVGEVVGDVLGMLQPLADRAGVRLLPPPPGIHDAIVLADIQRLKQVLLNLLGNAIKYNGKGGTVIVSCVEAGAMLRINVTDTGLGIAPEKIPRLFDPFDRLDEEHNGEEGTGLGLAVSKRLVESMHGRMGVESSPGRGSTFWVELPLTDRTDLLDLLDETLNKGKV